MKKRYIVFVLLGVLLLIPSITKAYTIKLANKNNNSLKAELNDRYSFENKIGGGNILYVKPIDDIFNKKEDYINVKIGLIRDGNLLDSLMNNEERVYEDFVKYAKKDKKSFNITLSLMVNEEENENSYQGNIRHLNVINGAYYYIYVEEDDLVPEGVMLGQGNRYLLVNDVKWPNKTLIKVVTIIFSIYMCIPLLFLIYFIYIKKDSNVKKRKN